MGQLGKDTFSEVWTGFQPKMIMVPYRFLNFYDIFFESTVRRQIFEIVIEHKPLLGIII